MDVSVCMKLSFTEKKSIRKNFGKLKESLSIPNLIDVQKKSYSQFLTHVESDKINLQKGLDRVFKSIFPIEEISEKATLEYLSFRFFLYLIRAYSGEAKLCL